MVEEVDAAQEGRRHPRRHRRGPRLRLPPGLGSHVQWDRKLDARLAAALMGIQAIKGVEIGDGFTQARRRGSAGPRRDRPDAPAASRRLTNRAGGTRGRHDHRRAAARPRRDEADLHRCNRALQTVDITTGEPATAINQRSDVCAVPAAGVVAEAMVALVLAEARSRSSAATPSPRSARNLAGYLEHLVIR